MIRRGCTLLLSVSNSQNKETVIKLCVRSTRWVIGIGSPCGAPNKIVLEDACVNLKIQMDPLQHLAVTVWCMFWQQRTHNRVHDSIVRVLVCFLYFATTSLSLPPSDPPNGPNVLQIDQLTPPTPKGRQTLSTLLRMWQKQGQLSPSWSASLSVPRLCLSAHTSPWRLLDPIWNVIFVAIVIFECHKALIWCDMAARGPFGLWFLCFRGSILLWRGAC